MAKHLLYGTVLNLSNLPGGGGGLFSSEGVQASRECAISDDALRRFRSNYKDKKITNEDIFYYVYGLLHSEQYREKYKHNLSKQMPRIPLVNSIDSFRKFSAAGRCLGKLHVDFEKAIPYPVNIKLSESATGLEDDLETLYRVNKMKFARSEKGKDMSKVIYNAHITITGIPIEAYKYVVSGQPALKWVMNRQCVKTHEMSGIVDDANLYAIETMGDPAYPLELFKRVITVSIETMKIVQGLPDLHIG